jgi:hypothetical protein
MPCRLISSHAEIEIAQVVAGVVLLERPQAVPDVPRRRHHLEAEHELAGVAVVQHVHAAGVGREVAADGAAALGGKAQREQPVVRCRRLLNGLQHDTRLDGHAVADRIDLEDAVHAIERQHDLAAALVGRAAARHAGVAALGHDRDLLGRTQFHHGSDFLGAGWPDDGQRRAEVIVAPVGEVGVLALRVGDQAAVADDGSELVQECAHWITHV